VRQQVRVTEHVHQKDRTGEAQITPRSASNTATITAAHGRRDKQNLLDSCAELAAERRELIRVLQQLRHTFPAVRQALNEMATIIALPTQPPPPVVTSLDRADRVSAKELNRRPNDGSSSR
jgi:hypothetical protein